MNNWSLWIVDVGHVTRVRFVSKRHWYFYLDTQVLYSFWQYSLYTKAITRIKSLEYKFRLLEKRYKLYRYIIDVCPFFLGSIRQINKTYISTFSLTLRSTYSRDCSKNVKHLIKWGSNNSSSVANGKCTMGAARAVHNTINTTCVANRVSGSIHLITHIFKEGHFFRNLEG